MNTSRKVTEKVKERTAFTGTGEVDTVQDPTAKTTADALVRAATNMLGKSRTLKF